MKACNPCTQKTIFVLAKNVSDFYRYMTTLEYTDDAIYYITCMGNLRGRRNPDEIVFLENFYESKDTIEAFWQLMDRYPNFFIFKNIKTQYTKIPII